MEKLLTNKKGDSKYLNRRNFFKKSFLVAGTLASFSILNADSHNHTSPQNSTTEQSTQDSPPTCSPQIRGRMFFMRSSDFEVLSSACERIYPKDESGEGAIGLGVPYFIDNQLAGAYGFNAREYMQAPFMQGKPEQGYQSPMYRRDIFLYGVRGLEARAIQKYKNGFALLDEAKQDEILREFESGKAKVDGIDTKYFFTLLRDMTLAGVLSDPIYQGNHNKEGWKMMQYPGAQMVYSDKIESDEFFEIEPISLAEMQ